MTGAKIRETYEANKLVLLDMGIKYAKLNNETELKPIHIEQSYEALMHEATVAQDYTQMVLLITAKSALLNKMREGETTWKM